MSSIDEMSRRLAEAVVKETEALRKTSERGAELTRALMELGWTPPGETPQSAPGDVSDAVKALPELEPQDGRRHRVVIDVTTEKRMPEKQAAELVRAAMVQCAERSDRFRYGVTRWKCKGFRRVVQGLRRVDQ